MIVDICAYFGKWPYWPIDACTPAAVVEELGHCGIDRAAVLSTRGLFVGWEEGNLETEEAVRGFPGRLVSFACLGPLELSHTLQGHIFDFDKLCARGFLGVRLYPQYHTYHPLYEPFVDQILEEAEMRQWPVLLPLRVIMNWGMPSLSLDWMVAIVERHPRTPWILSGINYFHELRAAVSLMRRFSTVHLETSCVQGFNAIAKLVEQCGSDNLLLGTGLPLQNGSANLQKILRANIPEPAREKILGGNACRLLRLEGSQ
ncbi:MAG: amidohydrolase [Acidobacteria bacterium]|nr:amidohydrolase [Acidobacteriota bacterium]